MAKRFETLRAKMSPEARAQSEQLARTILAEMPLSELRRARRLSQETLAAALEATQGEVSKIEHRTDLYVSTLRRYIEAMGGTLEIRARFPDGDVQIANFEALASPDDEPLTSTPTQEPSTGTRTRTYILGKRRGSAAS